MTAEALDSQDRGRLKNRIGVIICGHIWLKADQKIQGWIRNHPDEKILDRIPILFCVDSERYCGGLMVETNKESLPSYF